MKADAPVKAEVEDDKARDDDDDDEVVAVYDVFAAQQLSGAVQVFQFPLRPAARPYEFSHVHLSCTKGVVQQQQQQQQQRTYPDAAPHAAHVGLTNPTSRFMMEVELETLGSDSFRARAEDDPYSAGPDSRMFRYALESSPYNRRSEYVLGVVRDGEIHLTPISAVQQFTPVGKPRSKDIKAADLVSAIGASAGTASGGAVQSTLDRQLKRLRSVSLADDAATRERFEYFPAASVESKTVAGRLLCSTMTTAALAPKRAAAVDAFFPREPRHSIGSALRKTILARYASSYPVASQVEDLLRSCQVVHLMMLAQHVRESGAAGGLRDSAPPFAEMMAALRRRAVYMHGLWFVADCPGYQLSEAAIREVVLLQFACSSNGTIARRDVNAHFAPNPAVLPTVLRVLQDVAVLVPNADPTERRWRLKFVDDATESAQIMQQLFPDDVTRQAQTWKARAEEIRALVHPINTGRPVQPKQLRLVYASGACGAGGGGGGGGFQQQQQQQQQQGGRASADSRRPPEELSTAAHATIRRVFRAHGVVNRQVAKEFLRALTKRPSDKLFQCPDTVLVEAMRGELVGFTDTTWILQRPENPQGRDVRAYFIAAMREKHSFTLKDCIERATQQRDRELQAKGEGGAETPIDHATGMVIASELAEYHPGERLWHVKSGNVKLL